MSNSMPSFEQLQALPRNRQLEAIPVIEELNRRRAATDPVFFIDHYLKTFDPRPEAFPHHLDFVLYDFQEDYILGLVDAIKVGYDVLDEKSRDMGVSWLSLAVRFWLWLFDDGYQALIGSRKEDYVDNGTLDSLFGKLDYFIERIKDPKLLPKGFDIKRHRTYMKLVNPVNGNTIKGESSNKNFSRGGRYKDVFFDELGFWPDARQSWTAAGDATRCRHGVTTPPDEPSYAKTLRFSDRVKVRTFHWRLHPKKDDKWYAYEKTRRTEEEVLHELDISWEYSSTGRPYPEAANIQLGQYDIDLKMPLYLSMDLGLDAVAIGYYQPQPNSDWLKLIEAFEASDHIIEWFFPMFGLYDCVNVDKCPYPACGKQHYFEYTDKDLEFMRRVRYWQPTVFFGDPSGKARHIESGISAYTILALHGIDVQVNDLENDWVSRRDALKRILPKLMVNDTERTRWWLECMKNAHYPKRDELSQAITAISAPVHDWTSHHRTQGEFFAVNYKGQAYDNRATGSYGPNNAPQQPESPYFGVAKGETIGQLPDVGKIIREAQMGAHDWRNS